MFIDHTFHIVGNAVKKREMTNILNRDNWDDTKFLKIYILIVFCTCKIDTIFTRTCMECSVATSSCLDVFFFKDDALMWL